MLEQNYPFVRFQMLVKAAQRARSEGRVADAAKLYQYLLYLVRGWLPPPDSLEEVPLFGKGSPSLEELLQRQELE